MKRFSLLAAGVIALAFAAFPTLAVASGSSRTFVSGTGSDSNNCSLPEPCRSFAGALAQTAPSGEIIVLSSAGYGAVTINQAVSIINVGYFAGVSVSSGNGITINAGTGAVTLRGLTIDGGGNGANGIAFYTGGALTIDQCDVINFVGTNSSGNGIIIQPTSGNYKIVITNTTASNNQNVGVQYGPISSTATAQIVIDHVSANNNSYGFLIDDSGSSGAAKASISNSTGSFNSSIGFYFANLTTSLDASNAASNGTGVYVQSSTLALGRSVLMNNSIYGLEINGGTVNSYKDNRIAGNNIGQVSGTPATATLY
jgi:hypothetical protein